MSRLLIAAAAIGVSALPAAAGCVGQCYRPAFVPPTYENVVEKVMVRAPRTYALTTPAEYRQVHETVLVQPASRHWSVTRDAHGHPVGCWVTTPARYGTVSRTVMVRGPQVVPYAEPAQYGLRSYSVQTQPGYRTWAPVPSSPAAFGGRDHGGGYGGGYGPRGKGYGAGPGYGRAQPAAYRPGGRYGATPTRGGSGYDTPSRVDRGYGGPSKAPTLDDSDF